MNIFSRRQSQPDHPTPPPTTPESPSPIVPAHSVLLVKDASGAPAVDLTKLAQDGHVDLAKRAQKAGISLSKRSLSGVRARVMLLLDHSGSMHSDYALGKVQTLTDRALGFTLQLSASGVVSVIPFDTVVHPVVKVGAYAEPEKDVYDYRGVVDTHIWRRHGMGSTNLADALEVVRQEAIDTTEPIFCVIVTDGSPDRRNACTKIVIDLARYAVFLKFIAVREVPYLQELDDLPASRRLLDNVDAKSFNDPSSVSDLAFAEAMTDEWDTWIAAATAAGILR